MIDFKRFNEIRSSMIRAGMCEIEAHDFANQRMMMMRDALNDPNVSESDFIADETDEEETED